MRAIASSPLLDPSFFIVMDRLYETLDRKIASWLGMRQKAPRGLFGMFNKKVTQQLLLDRLIVAYDLAAAFWYMHQNKLIYRDIKQENIGFDVRGDVKVFDFGLAKSPSPSLRAKDDSGREIYGYNITPRTGSIPYMAPEVAECRPYEFKCDVFSFSVLLWEILSLKDAFKGYSRREFIERVVRKKQRLAIDRRWPPLTRMAIREGWDDDPQKRPDMKRLKVLVRSDLDDLTTDSSVRDRSNHMRDRSSHSVRPAKVGTT